MKRAFAFVLAAVLLAFFCASCTGKVQEYSDVGDYGQLFQVNELLCGLGCSLLFPLASEEDFNDTVAFVEGISDSEGAEKYPSDEAYWSMVKPPLIDGLQVQNFYLRWSTGFVGSARAECIVSVQYDASSFELEKHRIASIRGTAPIVYDTTSFQYPAYVTALDLYGHTNQYALLDKENCVIHYVHFQIVDMQDLKIKKDLLPIEYGETDGQSYYIFE